MTENNELENIPENIEIPEPEIIPNPWDNAPTNVYFYEKIYNDGHLGSFTQSAELAYKSGWDIENNYISIEDTQQSDINGWTYRKELCPMKGLTEKKQDKLAELSMIANKFEQNKCDSMFVVSSLGYRVNADRRSLQNVENLIRIGQETIFKDYDNQFRSVTIQDLETLALEISINGSNLYNQKFRMQNAVLNASTKEELENFEIEFKMMDFTE